MILRIVLVSLYLAWCLTPGMAIGGGSGTSRVAIGHTGKQFATCDRNFIRIWNCTTGSLEKSLVVRGDPLQVLEFSRDDKRIYAIDTRGRLTALNTKIGLIERNYNFKTSDFCYYRISAAANMILQVIVQPPIQVQEETRLKLYSLDKQQAVFSAKFQWEKLLQACFFSPDGEYLSWLRQPNVLQIYNLKKGRIEKTITVPDECVTVLARSRKWGRQVFDSVSGFFSTDNSKIALYADGDYFILNINTSRLERRFRPYGKTTIVDSMFDAGASKIISDCCLFDVPNGRIEFTFPTSVEGALDPDSNTFYYRTTDGLYSYVIGNSKSEKLASVNTGSVGLLFPQLDALYFFNEKGMCINTWDLRTRRSKDSRSVGRLAGGLYDNGSHLLSVLNPEDKPGNRINGFEVVDVITGNTVASFSETDLPELESTGPDDVPWERRLFRGRVLSFRDKICFLIPYELAKHERGDDTDSTLGVAIFDIESGSRLVNKTVPFTGSGSIISAYFNGRLPGLFVTTYYPGELFAHEELRFFPYSGERSRFLADSENTRVETVGSYPIILTDARSWFWTGTYVLTVIDAAWPFPDRKEASFPSTDAIIAHGTNRRGTFIATSAAEGVFVRSVPSLKKIVEVRGLDHAITALAFSADDRWLFAAGDNAVLYVIDARTWKIEATLYFEEDRFICSCILATGRYWSEAKTPNAFFKAHSLVRSDPAGAHRDKKAVESFFRSIEGTDLSFPVRGVCNDTHVRIRQQPTLSGKILGELNTGERVMILEKQNRRNTIAGLTGYWYKIKTAGGKIGWSFGVYIDVLK